jgi:hypothetical protein
LNVLKRERERESHAAACHGITIYSKTSLRLRLIANAVRMHQDNGLNWPDAEAVRGYELLTEVITKLSLLGYDAVCFGTFCRKLLPPS